MVSAFNGVKGIAYTGALTVMVGDTDTFQPWRLVVTLCHISDDCCSLSGNFVTVYRRFPTEAKR